MKKKFSVVGSKNHLAAAQSMEYFHSMMRIGARWLFALVSITAIGCAHRPPEPSTDKNLAGSLSTLSAPLDVREYNVAKADGARGVFLKLSRLPDSVTHRSESHPARIIVEIAGPTGVETPEEVFP